LEIRSSFIQQLAAYESRLSKSSNAPRTSTWSEISDPSFGLENEELILRNTYVNAMLLSLVSVPPKAAKEKREESKVKWIDNKPEQKQELASVIPDPTNLAAIIAHRTIPKRNIKSIIRPSEEVPLDLREVENAMNQDAPMPNAEFMQNNQKAREEIPLNNNKNLKESPGQKQGNPNEKNFGYKIEDFESNEAFTSNFPNFAQKFKTTQEGMQGVNIFAKSSNRNNTMELWQT
jgi:hypothetical protein